MFRLRPAFVKGDCMAYMIKGGGKTPLPIRLDITILTLQISTSVPLFPFLWTVTSWA